jgi:NAD(P)-dependent dehydrogenase (short-subunit alcohol dehydrogenase family)
MLMSLPTGGVAVVVGATGGIGAALLELLQAPNSTPLSQAIGLSRNSKPALDLLDEASIAHAAQWVRDLNLPLRLVVDATGMLSGPGHAPEKTWSQLDAAQMAHAFAINAIGPALLMKHFLPLLARQGKAVFATLSAKVGSIGDNRLGGWYSYRASKAALNQLVHTAAVELKRRQPQSICVALHPGTVDTRLSASFAKTGLDVQTPAESARRMLAVIEGLSAGDSGGFFNHDGSVLPW